MEDLIKALQIFLKYDNQTYPTHCEHDELWIIGNYDPSEMSKEDVDMLDELGFFWSENDESFKSFKYGSA
jgi:hypothetical protein